MHSHDETPPGSGGDSNTVTGDSHMNTPDRRSETGSPVAPDVVAVNDRELETCKGDLWRIIAQAIVLVVPVGITCAVTNSINLGLMFKVYTIFPRPRPSVHDHVHPDHFGDPIYPPRGSSTTLRPTHAAALTMALWYCSLCSFIFALISAVFLMKKLLNYIKTNTISVNPTMLETRRKDSEKYKFLDKVEFLRMSVQTGVMFLLIGVCEFARSISPSISWVVTTLLTAIEAVFVWHLFVSWSTSHAIVRRRGFLGNLDNVVQDDENIGTWVRGELLRLGGLVAVRCVQRILQVRLDRPVLSYHDIADVGKMSSASRLALVQILNDALQGEIQRWEESQEIVWASWIGEAVAGIDNILSSALSAPEFETQAELSGSLIIKLLSQRDAAIAKFVLLRLSLCFDPLVGEKLPQVTSDIVFLNLVKSGEELAQLRPISKGTLRKTIQRIAEHGRSDIASSYEGRLKELYSALSESSSSQDSGNEE